jgi:superfamily II DNA/RNA helicase
MRSKILADFKSGKISFLVATDIASRGIDIDDLTRVINYDLPNDTDDYVHRIGRTGRAGNSGEAVSLISKDDFKSLCAIESRIGHVIQRNDLEEFKPRKEVPISILNYVPKNKPQAAKGKPRNNEKKASVKGRPSTPKQNSNVWGNKPSPWGE